ncbi:MAG: hypothetical protein IJQ83_00130 [Bacteroidales bacterium]|nr:hypothetical protein [Bacteroidales bacterium]
MEGSKHFLKKFSRQNEWSDILHFIQIMRRRQLPIMNAICWNLDRVEEIHEEMLKVIGWMNRDLPKWVKEQERFDEVCLEIRKRMEWE